MINIKKALQSIDIINCLLIFKKSEPTFSVPEYERVDGSYA